MNKPSTSQANREERTSKLAPGREEIAARAHALWEEDGCPNGHDQEHWLKAERELQSVGATSAGRD
jgi:Protein of unknown function (DUF2934)